MFKRIESREKMNTDAILDFVVDNYIWFIVGGAIIILAIIGVIAEKKKIIPKKKEIELDGKKDENTINSEPSTQKIEELTFNEGLADSEMLDSSDLEKSNNVETLSAVSNEDTTNNQVETEKLDSESVDELKDESDSFEITDNLTPFELEKNDVNIVQNSDIGMNIFSENPTLINEEKTNSELEKNEFESIPNESEKLETNDEIITNLEPAGNIVNDLSDDSTIEPEEEKINTEELKNDSFDHLSFSSVDDDINRINNMNFSDKEDDKLEDTMQISYSQLKEIVQDIISENEDENEKKGASFDNTDVVKTEEPAELSTDDKTDLNESNINDENEKIAPQDDEDDVWKF